MLAAAAICALSTWGVASAAAQAEALIETGAQGRYQIHTTPREGESGAVDAHYFFLLDTRSAAVYTRIGQGVEWTQYAAALDIKAHPKGEEWKAPRFDLRIISAPGADPILLLVNSSSGATYTRSNDGTWARFMRATE
jgi:hypothetical protein